MDRRIVNCQTGVIASDLPTGYVWANWIDTLRTVVNGGSWPVCDRRVRRPRLAQPDYTSVCSAISSASSTSIPRYLTVLSSLV
jgi:hypothetical protein